MHNNILKAIKSYYNQKNTDYAILLNGCWGTGKTFFVENTLKKDAIIDKNCKVISISASGINDVDSFIKNIYLRIALEKLPSYKKRKKIYKSIIKGINFLSNALNDIQIDNFSKYGKISKFIIDSIKKFIINKESDFSNILFVIDDIERISDSINIEDILYKIYELFILQGLKVIFVCNEKEIYSNNSEKKSNYFRIKEKVIRHTINFYRLDNSMFGEIIKSIIKDNEKYYYYKNFINNDNHIEKLINIFIVMNHLNIRTFLTYLDLSKQIFNINEIQKGNDFDNDFMENLLYKLALIIIGIVNGNEDMLDEYYINNNYEKYSEYVNKINKLEIFIYPTTIYIDIKNYIKTGYLETLNIIENYNSIMHSKVRRKFSEYYEKLQNYNIQNENDIKEAINIVFNKIKECLNNTSEVETKYAAEYIRDFNNLKGCIDLYDENIYKKEIEEYIELAKKINNNYFDNLNLNVDSDIEKIVVCYNDKKYNKPTYKNSKMYEIDKYYESKLDNAYKKAKEIIENKLIKTFEDKKMERYFYSTYINRIPIYNLIMEYDFLMKLEVNAYNIDVIIGFLYINMLNIGNASNSFDRNNKILIEVKKYLNDDKIKNVNYDNNTNKKIEELKSVVEKAEEHIKPNK